MKNGIAKIDQSKFFEFSYLFYKSQLSSHIHWNMSDHQMHKQAGKFSDKTHILEKQDNNQI